MKKNLHLTKKNTNQLRDIAVELGADRKRLYGTSKQALIHIIHKLMKEVEENGCKNSIEE